MRVDSSPDSGLWHIPALIPAACKASPPGHSPGCWSTSPATLYLDCYMNRAPQGQGHIWSSLCLQPLGEDSVHFDMIHKFPGHMLLLPSPVKSADMLSKAGWALQHGDQHWPDCSQQSLGWQPLPVEMQNLHRFPSA